MDLQDVLNVMGAFAASSATELVLEIGGARMELRKGGRVPPTASPVKPASAEEPPAASLNAIPLPSTLIQVQVPTGGVFYRRPTPDSPLFVSPGDRVEPGQVMGLVEVMKMTMDIKSPARGTLKTVLVEDGTPVAAGQPVLELEVGDYAGK